MTGPDHEVILADRAGDPVEVWCPTSLDWVGVDGAAGIRCEGCQGFLVATGLSVQSRSVLACVETREQGGAVVLAVHQPRPGPSTTSVGSAAEPCGPRSRTGPDQAAAASTPARS